jgi:mannose-6-phosphate isomerase-like protein (cupin superfamily)
MKMSAVHIVAKDDGEAFHVGPIHIRVLEDGSRTNSRFGAVEITVPPHTDQTPHHLHRMHDETFLVTKGRLRFWSGDDHHDVGAGGYVIVTVGARHTFANPFDETAVFFNTFTPSYFVDYLRELSKLTEITPQNILNVMAGYATLPA